MPGKMIAMVALASALAACRGTPQQRRGADAINRYGCGSCHTIPYVPGAHGKVGPPLAGIANRMYAAGVLLNTPENLTRWIERPSMVKRTAMPDLDVTPADASDIVAFLERLK